MFMCVHVHGSSIKIAGGMSEDISASTQSTNNLSSTPAYTHTPVPLSPRDYRKYTYIDR